MPTQTIPSVALKEWKILCELLAQGRYALTLRKGGIHEMAGPGRFEPEYERFLLWPSFEHQKPEAVKPEFRDRTEPLPEPETVRLQALAEVQRIWKVPSREAFDRLDDLHPWAVSQIDMRFSYKPERPLWLLALRVFPIQPVAEVVNRPDYAGCRSWVPLEAQDVPEATVAEPAMDEATFSEVLRRVDTAFG